MHFLRSQDGVSFSFITFLLLQAFMNRLLASYLWKWVNRNGVLFYRRVKSNGVHRIANLLSVVIVECFCFSLMHRYQSRVAGDGFVSRWCFLFNHVLFHLFEIHHHHHLSWKGVFVLLCCIHILLVRSCIGPVSCYPDLASSHHYHYHCFRLIFCSFQATSITGSGCFPCIYI